MGPGICFRALPRVLWHTRSRSRVSRGLGTYDQSYVRAADICVCTGNRTQVTTTTTPAFFRGSNSHYHFSSHLNNHYTFSSPPGHHHHLFSNPPMCSPAHKEQEQGR